MGTKITVPVDLDWMKWPILWLVLAAIFGFGIGSLNVPLFDRLVDYGVQTHAIVVKLTPEFHNTVCYEYQVGGVKFDGQSQSWSPKPARGANDGWTIFSGLL